VLGVTAHGHRVYIGADQLVDERARAVAADLVFSQLQADRARERTALDRDRFGEAAGVG